MATVSVIMSVHNGEKTVKRAAQSILEQTFDDLELIICDDMSTDATDSVLQELQMADKRVIVLKNEVNLGLGASLNRCMEVSTGRYIARMDDDDISQPDRIKEQICFLQAHSEYSYVGCNATVFDKDKIIGENKKPDVPTKKHFVKGSPYLHPTVVFRVESIRAVHGYSVKEYARKRAQDYELFMRMEALGYKGYNMQRTDLFMYYYNQKVTQGKRNLESVKNEMLIRWHGYRALKVKPWDYIYVLLPVAVYIKQSLIKMWNHKK